MYTNFFVFKSLLTMPSNVLPLHLNQTFPPIIWVFTEGEGDGMKSRLPFKIFSTLKCHSRKTFHASTVIKKISIFNVSVLRLMPHILLTYFWSYSQCVLHHCVCMISAMIYQSRGPRTNLCKTRLQSRIHLKVPLFIKCVLFLLSFIKFR